MPEKLKPCPFCGSEPYTSGKTPGYCYVICEQCNATCAFNDSDDLAIKAWNRRAPDTALDTSQGWIPVTERLPEKDKYVLLFLHNEEHTMITAGKIYNSEDAKFDGEFCLGLSETEPDFLKHEYITHWRELPEPPGE